jgi:N-formylglutamate deformylase
MYAGVNNTGLCPLTNFEGVSIYKQGNQPNSQDVTIRKQQYWQPYHSALEAELTRLKSIHGFAVLLDGHSIKSQLPWLFEGKLPDLNIGTVNGSSCAYEISTAIARLLEQESDFSSVMDGRFKGGYITRHFGQPTQNIHTVQLEMCWSTYMQEQAPYVIDSNRQAKITVFLQKLTLLLSNGISQKVCIA